MIVAWRSRNYAGLLSSRTMESLSSGERYGPSWLNVLVSDLFGGVYQSGESEEKMFLLAIRKSNRNYLLYVFRDMLGREIMVAAVIKSM